MRPVLTIGAVALLVFMGYAASVLVPASGVFSSRAQKLVDECARVDVFPGVEDVTIDPELNLAFLSAADRRTLSNGKVPRRGGVFVINLDGEPKPRRVAPSTPADLQPHGLSLWRGPDGMKRLFVINHRLDGVEAVEIFDVGERGALAHLGSAMLPEGSSPNDVVGVGPRSFYVTNDRGFKSGLMAMIENYLALPLSSVAFFDGEAWSKAVTGLVYANGINVSLDGKTIYVAELLRQRITVFNRDPRTNALKRARRFGVNTNPDNIEVANDGALWIAGHDRVFDFLKHAKDPRATAPSHVLRLSPLTGGTHNLFMDSKGVINASSVGAVWDRTLVVGGVFDGHVMVCPLLEIFFRTAPDYEGPSEATAER